MSKEYWKHDDQYIELHRVDEDNPGVWIDGAVRPVSAGTLLIKGEGSTGYFSFNEEAFKAEGYEPTNDLDDQADPLNSDSVSPVDSQSVSDSGSQSESQSESASESQDSSASSETASESAVPPTPETKSPAAP